MGIFSCKSTNRMRALWVIPNSCYLRDLDPQPPLHVQLRSISVAHPSLTLVGPLVPLNTPPPSLNHFAALAPSMSLWSDLHPKYSFRRKILMNGQKEWVVVRLSLCAHVEHCLCVARQCSRNGAAFCENKVKRWRGLYSTEVSTFAVFVGTKCQG